MRRRMLGVVVAMLLVAPVVSSLPARATPPPVRWVAVSVATLWAHPDLDRPVDQPALANPANPRLWVQNMTVDQKRWLVGKLETQALYGTKVYQLGTYRDGHGRSWSKIAVSTQPTPRSAWGYPGWVPSGQLTATAPVASASYVIVRSRTAWVYASPSTIGAASARIMEVSYDTRFALVRATTTTVEILMIDGRRRALRRADVVVHLPGMAWQPTRAKAVAESRKMLGLGYLWGGTSGFGYDCSGLTYSIFHTVGILLARDADPQAHHGTTVSWAALLPGDLMFYQDSTGAIVHVAMYYGVVNRVRSMIEFPATGLAVRIVPMRAAGFAGARRYPLR